MTMNTTNKKRYGFQYLMDVFRRYTRWMHGRRVGEYSPHILILLFDELAQIDYLKYGPKSEFWNIYKERNSLRDPVWLTREQFKRVIKHGVFIYVNWHEVEIINGKPHKHKLKYFDHFYANDHFTSSRFVLL